MRLVEKIDKTMQMPNYKGDDDIEAQSNKHHAIYSLLLIAVMVFGYIGSVFKELNAMDLYHCSARKIGVTYAAVSENEDCADPQEIEIARSTKDYIKKSMADSGILSDVTLDYDNKCIVYKIMVDGVAQSIQDDNDEKWGEVCEQACDCSRDWMEGIRKAGLDLWDFSIVILNDYYPKNALAIFTEDRKSTRLNSSHTDSSRMPSSA